MRKIVLLLLLALCTVVLMSGGCATMKGKWEDAARKDTVEGYNAFLLNENPDAEYAGKARLRIQELEKKKREKEEEDSFQDILKERPASWDEKSQERHLEEYLKKYPSGKHVVEAEKMLEQSVFKRAEKQNYAYPYDDFVSRFPKSDLVQEAASRARRISYDNVRKTATVAEYEWFIKKFPEGEDTRSLEKELPKLRQQELARNRAVELGQIALKMAPVIKAKTRVLPNGVIEQSGPLKVAPPDNLKYRMEQLRKLLNAGADPNLIRIKNYQPHYVYPNGFTTSFGQPGEVVPATGGGITLLEYFKKINLKEAADLIKKHGGK